ncbi:hypothetical protein RRG08_002282 [Elysia crispata]|uniref:Uncharacterized protein n=1 Tax=Elysia crispata TaxID=231223 RepID=A0AAE0ZAY9_9GAST|nr:hypothetical protein RRG08_002282 [Elysia crispata]
MPVGQLESCGKNNGSAAARQPEIPIGSSWLNSLTIGEDPTNFWLLSRRERVPTRCYQRSSYGVDLP